MERCKLNWCLSKDIALDECTPGHAVPLGTLLRDRRYGGRTSLKKRTKHKKVPEGFDIKAVADSDYNYLWTMTFFGDKLRNATWRGLTYTGSCVMNLLTQISSVGASLVVITMFLFTLRTSRTHG